MDQKRDLTQIIGDEDGTVINGKWRSKDELITVGKGHGSGDLDTGGGDRGEEENGHYQDCLGDSDESGGEFGKDSHEKEEETASKHSIVVGIPSKVDDSVVLSERTHGGDGAQSPDDAGKPVRQNTTLNTRVSLNI